MTITKPETHTVNMIEHLTAEEVARFSALVEAQGTTPGALLLSLSEEEGGQP
jgi:hypothetical protein